MKTVVKTRIKYKKQYYNAGDTVEMTTEEAQKYSEMVEAPVDTISDMTVAELEKLALEEGIDLAWCKNKSEKVKEIKKTFAERAEETTGSDEDSDYLDV